jgi:HPt (histidine-containing phosphotransfer) domain-containing protein
MSVAAPPGVIDPMHALDPDLLAQQSGGDHELMVELLELFGETLPDMLGGIGDRMASGDPTGVARAAHLLKGSAGNMAARGLMDAAAGLEAAALAADRATMAFWWGRLREEADAVGACVEGLLAAGRPA